MKWLDCQKVKFNQQLVVKLIHFVKKMRVKLNRLHLIQARVSKIIKNSKQKEKQTKNK